MSIEYLKIRVNVQELNFKWRAKYQAVLKDPADVALQSIDNTSTGFHSRISRKE